MLGILLGTIPCGNCRKKTRDVVPQSADQDSFCSILMTMGSTVRSFQVRLKLTVCVHTCLNIVPFMGFEVKAKEENTICVLYVGYASYPWLNFKIATNKGF